MERVDGLLAIECHRADADERSPLEPREVGAGDLRREPVDERSRELSQDSRPRDDRANRAVAVDLEYPSAQALRTEPTAGFDREQRRHDSGGRRRRGTTAARSDDAGSEDESGDGTDD